MTKVNRIFELWILLTSFGSICSFSTWVYGLNRDNNIYEFLIFALVFCSYVLYWEIDTRLQMRKELYWIFIRIGISMYQIIVSISTIGFLFLK